MITYRKAKPKDWPQINQLVQSVFQETISMADSFPLLFGGSPFSYVALAEEAVIGFIGVLPEELVVGDMVYYGSRIGAVCTAQTFQGKGIGRQLFRLMKEETSQLDFVLVSGQGQLYRSEGCELFGTFSESYIPPKEGGYQLIPYGGELEELFGIQALLQQHSAYFNQSASQLQQLIEAHGLANLFGSQQEAFLYREDERIVGCLISCQRGQEELVTEIIAYGGSDRVVIGMLQQLALSRLQVIFRAPRSSSLAQKLRSLGPQKEVQNAGTILFFNQELRTCQIPHTWDLGFL